MAELEDALASIEARIAEAQKSADRLTKLLRRVIQAARNGNINELKKGLEQIAQVGEDAAAAAKGLAGAWSFDTTGYLAGGFLAELKDAAAAGGIHLTEKDGRVYAFPLVLRIAPDQTGVRLGKRLERRIRPKVLAAQIVAMQKRPQRLPEQRFLDLLYAVYQQLSGPEWRRLERGGGPLVRLADVHRLLTLLPGSDYPSEEFGRDLLLLSRMPELRTKDGARFEFPGSALARERVTPVVIYDEEGRERSYLGLRFIKEA
jgi:hypothetical protein